MKYKAKIFMRFEHTQQDIRFLLVDRVMIKKDNLVLVTGARGAGKCQIKGSKVLMVNGEWKNIEDIQVGEEVISPQEDGTTLFSKVIGTHNRFEEDIYDIIEASRDKRKLYSCSWNHEIPTILPVSKRTSKDDSTPRIRGRKIKIWNAKKISKSKYNIGSHMCSFTTPAVKYKNFKDSTIEPYCLGVYLGDGSFSHRRKRETQLDGRVLNILNRSLQITSNNNIIMKEVSKTYPIISVTKGIDRAKNHRFSINGIFSKELIRLGLEGKGSGEKFIPKECLLSSIKYRRKLLAGLIDTDGYVSKKNEMSYSTKSIQLAEDVKNLVFSLGGYSNIKKVYKNCQSFKEKRLYYDILVSFKNPLEIPMLTIKKDRLKIKAHDPRNIAITAVKGNPAMIYGIELDRGSKWYITDNHMVTHNTSLSLKLILGFNDMKRVEEHYNEQINKRAEKKKKYSLDSLKPFNIETDMAFTRKELQELCRNNVKGFILADEAIVNVARRNSMTKANKILHEVLTINRKNCNTIFFCLPSIEDFDVSILQYVTHWIHIDDRGLGCVLLPGTKSIFGRKTWDIDGMKKIYEKFKEDNPTMVSVPYWLFSNFRGYVRFRALTSRVEERYLKIANEKKNADTIEEEVKIKAPRITKEKSDILDKLVGRLISGDIYDSAEYYAHCAEMDFNKNRLNKEVNELLAKKGDGRTANRVIKENKKKITDAYDGNIGVKRREY